MSRLTARSTFGWMTLGAALAGSVAFTGIATANNDSAGDTLTAVNNNDWVLAERIIEIPDTETVIRTYQKLDEYGSRVAHYQVSQDGGLTWSRDRQTSYEILLRYANFDPKVTQPTVNPKLAAGPDNRLSIVQFVSVPMDKFQQDIEALGGTVHQFIGNHAYVVDMDPQSRAAVNDLSYVRWVGAFHPAYKTEDRILNEYFPIDYGMADGAEALANAGAQDNFELGPQPILGANNRDAKLNANGADELKFNIMVFERGPRMKKIVAAEIQKMGGTIDNLIDEGFLLQATINAESIADLLAMNEVAFIDLWGEAEEDMDVAREIGGGNYIENTLGMTGQGVRVEVMDGNIRGTHHDFQNPPITYHGTHSGSTSHGTSTSGIVFGDGTANNTGRGMLPDAELKSFSDYDFARVNRYNNVSEMVASRIVLQSNSWGDPRTRDYNTIASEMDDILFLNDIVICQSQSNAGNQDSRPQAWAKNMVSVGGVRHYNTISTDDDCWCSGGSIGPAKDGRIKPEFTHFYDSIFTTSDSSDTAYTSGFGGTSGATPIVAGHFGLVFQMWHEEVFPGFGGGTDVFDSKPHMSTAKALVVNSAWQYEFSGSGDHSRVKQGWGMPDLVELYTNSADMLIIDESDVLSNLESTSYNFPVVKGRAELRVTMVYADPKGTPFASQHRINDLSVKATSPSGEVFWGNNGLLTENFSSSGGVSNVIDTVENIIVERPEPGDWTIEVFADEVNEDSHLETPETDVDYALVASLTTRQAPACMDLTVDNLVAGETATFTLTKNLVRGEQVAIVWGTGGNGTTFNNFNGYCASFGFNVPSPSRVIAQGYVDQNDEFVANKKIPGNLSGMNIMFQGTKKDTCPGECMSTLFDGQIQ